MRFVIRALQLNDYRNIKSGEILWLEPITSLVGPNESGKTSVIEAISQLSIFNLSIADTTKDTKRSNDGLLPELIFFLTPDSELRGELSQDIKNLTDRSLVALWVNSSEKNSWKVKLATYNPLVEKFKLREVEPIMVYKNVTDGNLGVKIGSDTKILAQNEEITLQGRSPQNALLVKLKKLEKVPEDTILVRVIEKIINNLPKIVWWPPREMLSKGIQQVYKQFYIVDSVPWEEFINKPTNYQSVKRLFDIASKGDHILANWEASLRNYHSRGDDRAIATYLNNIAKSVTNVIMERWNQSKISIDLSRGAGGALIISIHENNKRIEPSTRSEGFKWFLSFLLHFFANHEGLRNHVFLMDQPGEYLHPGGQKELRKRLEEITLDSNQIIYATQSPFLVDRNEWKKTKFLKKTDSGTLIGIPSKKDVVNDELLRESLGYTLADVGQANELNIVVEGFRDRLLLQTVANIVKSGDINKIGRTPVDFDLNRLSITDAKGIFGGSNVFVNVQNLRNSGLKAVGVYDSDEEGKKAFEESKKDANFGKFFHNISGLLPKSKVETGEDLIPEAIYTKALKSLKRSIPGKILESFLKKPRAKKLLQESINRDELWEQVNVLLSAISTDEKATKEFLNEKETELLLRVLNKNYKILNSEK